MPHEEEATAEFEPRSFVFDLDPELLANVLVTFSGGDEIDAKQARRHLMIAYWWVIPIVYLASAGALLLYESAAQVILLPIQAVLIFSAMPAIIALLFLASPGRHILRWRRDAKKHAQSTAPLSSGPIKLSFQQDAVEYTDRWLTVRYGWHAVVAQWMGPSALVLSMANIRLLVIPKTVFGSNDDLQRFAEELAVKIRNDGGKQAATRVLLESCDARCTGCGYNLRGTQSRECPECGQLIDLNEIPRQIMRY